MKDGSSDITITAMFGGMLHQSRLHPRGIQLKDDGAFEGRLVARGRRI
jgi:hypothetical protein